MSDYRRRRFLTDLLFVGGALVAAAGLATTGEAQSHTATPKPTASKSPEQLPMPGEPVAVPSPSQTPPVVYPPAGAPVPTNFNKPIKATPPVNKPKTDKRGPHKVR